MPFKLRVLYDITALSVHDRYLSFRTYQDTHRMVYDSSFQSWEIYNAKRYIFAVGPPKSEIMPVKPGTSRIFSTSRIIDVF
jgi:hypothetical protein